jgi:hypothetical protein
MSGANLPALKQENPMQIRHGALALAVTAALSVQAFGDSNAASRKMRATSHPSNTPAHFRFPSRPHATTDSVLYDQSGFAEDGVPAQDFQSTSDGYDSEGADDFVVTDAAGWTVSAFNFQVGFFTTSGSVPPPAGTTYDIGIYDDANGSPGPAVCSYSALPGALDPTNTNLSVSLSSSCVLAQGTYWVSLQAALDYPPQAFWSNASGSPIGHEAVWREAGGFATGCTSWTPVSTCGVGSGNPNLLFQVIGSAGSSGSCTLGGICLATTVGTDLAIDACGTADTLDATIGDQLNFCYTVTNETGVALDYHTLQNNVDGTFFNERTLSLPPGASTQYNVIETVGASNTWTSTWSAQDVPSGYLATVESGGGNCSDRIFADGFEMTAPGCPGSSFIDITASGTALDLIDDEERSVSMPFSFDFYGLTSSQICVDNNGLVLFGLTCPSFALYANASLPAPLPVPAIMPLWDDFDSESGNVYTDTRGATPNRQFIVEWFDRVHFNGSSNTDGATFELIFNEDGTLQFEYADVAYSAFTNVTGDPDDCSMGACATIGLQMNPTLFNQFSAFEASVVDDSGIVWNATTPQVFTSTDSVTVNVGAPQIIVNPATLAVTGTPGANGTIPFAIENHGNRDLAWTLDEAAPSNLHFPPSGARFAMPLGDPAKASTLRAPVAAHRGPGDKSARRSLPVPLATSTTTFAADIFQNLIETFDSTNSAIVNVVTSTDGQAFAGGAFVDGDFSRFYAISGAFGNFQNSWFAIDTASGIPTLIADATNNLDEGFTGLAYDETGGTMYAASATCASASHLWTIDRATGASSLVGEIVGASCIVAIAVNAQGEMYGMDLINDALYAIDKTNGNAALIGSLGFNANYAQDMAFDLQTGVLYLAGLDGDALTDSIYTVDLQTGAASLVAPIGSSLGEVDAMSTQSAGGPCAQPQDLPWLSLDAVAGTTLPGASSPVTATIDGTGTVDGDIRAGTICARSNDPQTHVVEVPLQYTFAAPPPPPSPTIMKTFAPTTIAPNQSSRLTITLSNGAALDSNLVAALTDALPPGMNVATPALLATTCGGAVSSTTDSVTLDAASSTIPAGGSCTVGVDVTVGGVGTFDNVIAAGALQTSTGTNATSATATLAAHIPPTISKEFTPPSVAAGTPSTLTITIADIDPGSATLTAPLTDAFPPGLVVAAIPNASTTCAGSLSLVVGAASIALDAGAIIPVGGCTITVDVAASAAGSYPNDIPAGALQTDFGTNAVSADATLNVN